MRRHHHTGPEPTPVSAGLDAFRRHRSRPTAQSDVVASLEQLAGSTDPRVVLAGLGRLSVEIGFADACDVELVDGSDRPFRMSAGEEPPPGERSPRAPSGLLVTPFTGASCAGFPSFSGAVVHWWATGEPTRGERLTAVLLVRHAVSIIERERLLTLVAQQDQRASELTMHAITGRALNVATGVVMHQFGVDAHAGEQVLRSSARERGTTPGDLALQVVHAGVLPEQLPRLAPGAQTHRAQRLRALPQPEADPRG